MSINPIALFPLRLVLFPGTPQLLHVFEPRYRELLSDCLEQERPFGLPLLPPDQHEPQPGDIGCTAIIKTSSRLPDGRSNILVEGGTRFVIESITESTKPYVVASVLYFDEDPTEPSDQDRSTRVQDHLDRVRQGLGMSPLNQKVDNPTAASFWIASQLDLDLDTAEELQRLTSTRQRLDKLDEIISRRETEARNALAAIERGRSNGKHTYRPDEHQPYE